MCGIAVALHHPQGAAVVRRMTDGLRHRGDVTDPLASPEPWVAACTRRLRIVDPEHGRQPMASADGALFVSFNGEIYNHAELRDELVREGVRFAGACDTEVVANALAAWGPRALTRFEGMFALVAVDVAHGTWLAARDPFGTKPLYVIEEADGVRLFCSEIAPLLAASETGEVMELPPGRLLTPAGCFRYPPRWASLGDIGEAELGEALRQAVRSRAPADAVVLFSGGLDSTLVTHLLREDRRDVRAFTLGTPTASDLSSARAYAEATGLDLVEAPCTADAFASLAEVDEVVAAMETFEPETVRVGRGTLALARAVHQSGCRIALSGDGADELFAGYVPLAVGYALGEEIGASLRAQCVDTLGVTALQRIDRGGLRSQVEIREPFLHASVARIAFGMTGAQLVAGAPDRASGKQPLRRLAHALGVPDALADRPKAPLNEGAGLDASQSDSSWVHAAESLYSDAEFAEGAQHYARFAVRTKEELLYLERLASLFDIDRVPHLRRRPFLAMPEGALTSEMSRYRVP